MQNRWSRNSGAGEASGRKPNSRMPRFGGEPPFGYPPPFGYGGRPVGHNIAVVRPAPPAKGASFSNKQESACARPPGGDHGRVPGYVYPAYLYPPR